MRMIYRHPHLGRFVSFNDTYLQVVGNTRATRNAKKLHKKET